MATQEKLIADLGSEEVRRVRENLNAVVTAVEALQPATVASADAGGSYTAAEQTLINELKTVVNALAAVDLTALRELVATLTLPTAPKFPTP